MNYFFVGINIWQALDKPSVMPLRIGGTRWVSHLLRAIENLWKSYQAVVQHLEQVSNY